MAKEKDNYYFISYRIDTSHTRDPVNEEYRQKLIDKTPFEYSINHNVIILFAQKITKKEYKEYKGLFDS